VKTIDREGRYLGVNKAWERFFVTIGNSIRLRSRRAKPKRRERWAEKLPQYA
jgi:hypothetical protein